MSPTNPDSRDFPYAQEWLDFEASSGGRFCCHGTVEEVREQFNGLTAQLKSMLPPPSEDAVTADYTTDENVPVRVYKPANAEPDLPLGLYIHSGGWICGSIDGEDHLARQLVYSVPCVLVSVDYRLAPENPFPAALDDCVSAYKFMAATASKLGGDTTKMFIVGGSAGGHLTITTSLRLIDLRFTPAPRCIFPLCPAVVMPQALDRLPKDLLAYEKPAEVYADAAMIDKAVRETCAGLPLYHPVHFAILTSTTAAYIGSSDPADPLLSPVLHPKLSSIPPVRITTSNKDPLNDDAYMFQQAIIEVGASITLYGFGNYPHFFHILPQLEMSQKFMASLANDIRERCHGDPNA